MVRHINSNKGILAVVHGRDDTDHNLYNLQRFKETTREALNYDFNKCYKIYKNRSLEGGIL